MATVSFLIEISPVDLGYEVKISDASKSALQDDKAVLKLMKELAGVKATQILDLNKFKLPHHELVQQLWRIYFGVWKGDGKMTLVFTKLLMREETALKFLPLILPPSKIETTNSSVMIKTDAGEKKRVDASESYDCTSLTSDQVDRYAAAKAITTGKRKDIAEFYGIQLSKKYITFTAMKELSEGGCSGDGFFDRLKRKEFSIDLKTTVAIIRKLLAIIQHIHSKGYGVAVLEPELFYITKEGDFKLVDYYYLQRLGKQNYAVQNGLRNAEPLSVKDDIVNLFAFILERMGGYAILSDDDFVSIYEKETTQAWLDHDSLKDYTDDASLSDWFKTAVIPKCSKA